MGKKKKGAKSASPTTSEPRDEPSKLVEDEPAVQVDAKENISAEVNEVVETNDTEATAEEPASEEQPPAEAAVAASSTEPNVEEHADPAVNDVEGACVEETKDAEVSAATEEKPEVEDMSSTTENNNNEPSDAVTAEMQEHEPVAVETETTQNESKEASPEPTPAVPQRESTTSESKEVPTTATTQQRDVSPSVASDDGRSVQSFAMGGSVQVSALPSTQGSPDRNREEWFRLRASIASTVSTQSKSAIAEAKAGSHSIMKHMGQSIKSLKAGCKHASNIRKLPSYMSLQSQVDDAIMLTGQCRLHASNSAKLGSQVEAKSLAVGNAARKLERQSTMLSQTLAKVMI